ncbi:MAG: response regulator [Acidobacteriota bacterium]
MRVLERQTKDKLEILVVEDSPTQAEELAHLLTKHGFRTKIATSGEAALDVISRSIPDVVLADIVMPGIDGYELCRRIKTNKRTRDLPVILVTVLSDPIDIVRGLECGADNFIVKPYQEGELISRIEYILANKALHKYRKASAGVEIVFGGKRHYITAGRLQILSLLLSSYDTAVKRNLELTQARDILAETKDRLEEAVRERTAALEAEIAERRRTEAVLAESERRYRELYDRSVAGLFRTTLDGKIFQCNDAFARILGYNSKEEIMPTNAKSFFFQPEDYEALLTELQRRGTVTNWEMRLEQKDGSLRWVLGNFAIVNEEGSDEPVIDGTVIDVTAHKKLEEQLRQAQKMESIGRLAGGIAHDFNNLLQALLSLTQVLRIHAGDPERFAATLEELEQHIKRGAALSRQLLLFARREVSQPEPLDLRDVIQGVSKLLRRLVHENVSIIVDTGSKPLPVHADRGQLEQVLLNLVVNASDAMPQGGKIEVRCGQNGKKEVWFEVSDTGCGISEEILDKIFDPFFTTKDRGHGSGLGLSVVHGIVTGHGGRIEVNSEVGKGSTFRIYLPCASAGPQPVERAEPSKPGELPQGHGERVLIVEDEEGARMGLREILGLLGYQVHALGSGEEAVQLPDTPPFDVLITDLVLPGIHGHELARTLRARWPELKVILMSGYAEGEALRRGVAQGEVHFLQKPFDIETLARTLRTVISEADSAG